MRSRSKSSARPNLPRPKDTVQEEAVQRQPEKNVGHEGLPKISDRNRDVAEGNTFKLLLKLVPLVAITGFLFAYGIFALCGANDRNLDLVRVYNLEWVYFSAFLFGNLISWLNFYPMVFKERIMQNTSGNLRANMYIYATVESDGTNRTVVLDSTVDVGMYNRANRSLHHFIENMGTSVEALNL